MRRVVLALLALLGWLSPSPVAAVGVLRGSDSSLAGPADVAAVLVALVAMIGWALLGWLAVIAGLQLLSTVPGGTGRMATWVASTLAPIGVRRGLAVLLGLSLATTAPATAWAAGPSLPAAASAAADLPDLDWPAARTLSGPPLPVQTGPSSPLGTVETAVEPPPPSAGPANSAASRTPQRGSGHVVAPGESLWSIAAVRLGPRATTAQIAASWPRWWQANRDAIGTDPDLLHPGTHLAPPTPSSESEHP